MPCWIVSESHGESRLMRKPRMHTWKWWRFSTMRQERFKEVLTKNTDVFDKDYIEAVQKRRSGARSMGLKLVAIQLPIFTFLVLSLIPIRQALRSSASRPGHRRIYVKFLLRHPHCSESA